MKRPKLESEYDQEIPQSQTADNPVIEFKTRLADCRKLYDGSDVKL